MKKNMIYKDMGGLVGVIQTKLDSEAKGYEVVITTRSLLDLCRGF